MDNLRKRVRQELTRLRHSKRTKVQDLIKVLFVRVIHYTVFWFGYVAAVWEPSYSVRSERPVLFDGVNWPRH